MVGLHANAALDHEPGELGAVDEDDPLGHSAKSAASRLNWLVVKNTPRLAWSPCSAPAKAWSSGRPTVRPEA